MKKILPALLIIALLSIVLMYVACGGSTTTSVTTASPLTNTTQTTSVPPTTTTPPITTPTTAVAPTTTTSTTTSTVSGKADLVISIRINPETPSMSDEIDIDITVTNIGNGIAAESSAMIFLSGKALEGSPFSFRSLEPGSSDTNSSLHIPAGGLVNGTYTLSALVDYDDLIVEANENNNESTLTFTVALI